MATTKMQGETQPTKKKDDRSRNFATVVYPESAPENWREVVSAFHVQGFISPLHKDDIDPHNQPKKPHYHVMLMFEGKKSPNQAKEMFDQINGVGLEIVQSARGYARYLCHLDNPEKAQYDASEVISLCGADYMDLIGLSKDKYVAVSEMMDFCENYDVVSFYALSKYANRHRPDWSRVLIESSAIYMREYLKSRQWSKEAGYGDIVDPETGEVIS